MVERNQQWLVPRLLRAAAICNQPECLDAEDTPLWLGIDLGTCDLVSMVVNGDGQPVAVCLDWADVVRDGVVWDFFGAVTIVRNHLDALEKQLGFRFEVATTSFPPGTDPRISVNVLEAAGLTVANVLDEPSAVAEMMRLDKAAVVDIGGGTTGIAIVRHGVVVRSGDEATGGHHISLTLAGNQRIELAAAEQLKRQRGEEFWSVICPVYQKMADIVEAHLQGEELDELWLAGGACMLPGVQALFQSRFPQLMVVLPPQSIFMTPLAVAVCGLAQEEHGDGG